MLHRHEPHLMRRRRDEVGEEEDERAGRGCASVRCEMVEGALEPVDRTAVLQRPQALVAELDELAISLRLTPVRIAVRVVEVADEPSRGARAREDQLDDGAHRLGLVEPRQRGPEAGHLRAPVAHDHDLRRLLGEALAHHELVLAACCRQPGRSRPVDRGDVVSRPVRTRARNIGARASAKTLHRPERQPDHASTRNERKGEASARHGPTYAGSDPWGLTPPPSKSGSSSEPGCGASSRQLWRNASIAFAQPVARARATKAGVNTTRCTRTGSKSRSMSSGTT